MPIPEYVVPSDRQRPSSNSCLMPRAGCCVILSSYARYADVYGSRTAARGTVLPAAMTMVYVDYSRRY